MDRTQRSMLARLITWLIVGIIVVLIIRLLFAIVGAAWSIFLAIVPLVIIGWLAMKLWDRYQRRPQA